MSDLKITNAFYKHKPSHQTTWKSAMKQPEGRKNPYRFQIDYILTKNLKGSKILDSRAYNSYRTPSDHKPVMMEINVKVIYKKSTKSLPKIKVQELKEHQEKYKEIVSEKSREVAEIPTISEKIQDKWDLIGSILKESA